jgi:hypothetical protein
MAEDVSGSEKSLTDALLSWKKILPLTVPEIVMDEMGTKYFPEYREKNSEGC